MSRQKAVDTKVRYSPKQIPTLIRAHYNADPKEPLNFIAEPSTVKSEGTRQTARELAKKEEREFFDWNNRSLEDKKDTLHNPEKYFVFADLRASETDVGEMRLQNMDNAEDFITFKYNILFKVLSQDEAKGILFFDEMNLAPNMIKAQFYKIINDKAVGDIPLSDGLLCISAGNEAEHARGVTEDPVPLVLRRANYFLRPLNADEYIDYASSTGHHKYVLGYLSFRNKDVHDIKYDKGESVGQPCPRTWTKLSNILSNNNLTTDEIQMIATGLVGQASAQNFVSYIKSAQKVDVDEILKDPSKIKEYEQNEENLSLVWAITSEIVERYRNDIKGIAVSAAEVSLEFERPEFGVYMMRCMKNVDKKKFKKAFENEPVFEKFVDRYVKYFK